ncbi:nucleoside hydrolase [Neiella marina]|uniref:Nucleoside hydrolase n=2 Tax=Neiella holothuriorum TaxID=2870530 RepID=A0ABS7EBV1_9GAMM|nr:nucleoside hydrolase [Neiella holothuriorum]
MAIDDWAALLYLLQHPDADVKAITISSSGESRCQPGLRNTAALIDLIADAPSELPFACGDAYPLDGYAVFPEPWRVDSDTLSGVEIPASTRVASPLHAAELIHQTLQEQTQLTTLIATGPLTNIAQWLAQYPEDKAKVDKLVIMGGNVHEKGNIIVPNFTDGHPNKQAEWNIFVDPLAADLVLQSGLAIELVGLDVTNSVRVTESVAAEFKQQVKTPASQFWDRVLDKNDWFIASGEYYFWDTLAVLIAVNPLLCEGEQLALQVGHQVTDQPYLATSDLSMPTTRWDGRPRQHLDAATAGVMMKASAEAGLHPIKVCFNTQPKRIFSEFNQTLNRS